MRLTWRTLLAATTGLAAVAAAETPRPRLEPLAPVRGSAAATMRFTALPPEQTGLVAENRFADPRMWGEKYQEITYGAIGTGVAIGDYDNDGRPDVFVVSKTEQSRLFRNLGGWKFEDVTIAAGLAEAPGWWEQGLAWVQEKISDTAEGSSARPWEQGATFADIDNDGDLDLYVCRFDAPNQLWVNQGNGRFQEEAAARGLALHDASGMAAFADFDRDGWLDVYVQTNLLDAGQQPNGREDYLLRNTGGGRFVDVTRAAGIAGESAGHSVTWWDYDHDGWPDVYVANDFATADRLYRNRRDGTFEDVIHSTMPHLPYYAMGADLGDVDNDGLTDFLVADMLPTSHVRDQRGMAGSRARAQLEPEDAMEAPQVMRNALYVNTGAPRFLEAAELTGLPASDWTWSVRFEDLDNDGWVDVHLTNGMNREYHNADLLAKIMGAENLGEPRRIMRASPVMNEANVAFRNVGGLNFEPVAKAWGLDQRGVSFGAAFGDLDGDGDLDLVHGNYEAGPTVLRNDSPSGHRAIVRLQGTRSNRWGVGATVTIETAHGRQVRQLTLARGYLSSSEPVVHFGLGEAERIERLHVRWPSGEEQTWTDLPANHRITLVETTSTDADAPADRARTAPQEPWLLPVAGTSLPPVPAFAISEPAKLQALVPFDLNRQGPHLATGDFNGDGVDDVVISGTTLQPPQVALAEAEGGFRSVALPRTQRPAVDDGPVAVFDANGDGSLDVFITKAGVREPAEAPAYQPELWLGDGRGGFRPPTDALPVISISAGAVTVGDFNGDGRPDVFVGARSTPGAYPAAPRSLVLLNRGSRFEADASAPPANSGLVTAAFATDLDLDGWTDLLLATEWGRVTFWRNEAGQGWRDASESAGFAAAGNGWWSSLAIADVNADGRPDVVAGNVGLNTPYDASPEQPAVLLYGPFAANGGDLVIETIAEDQRLYPRRTRAELAARMPGLLRRFPRNDVFARTPVEEVLGDALESAQRFTATEFRTGVFVSQPDGRFAFRPLPREAQIAPARALQVEDLDGDGKLDLLVLQNAHTPIARTGRFGGGLGGVWIGDGQGGFKPVRAGVSGFVQPGQGESIVRLQNAAGGPLWLISQHRLPLTAFRQRER